jgi:hypothetical protein
LGGRAPKVGRWGAQIWRVDPLGLAGRAPEFGGSSPQVTSRVLVGSVKTGTSRLSKEGTSRFSKVEPPKFGG